jgi:thioredoxin reductase-like selenoprotein T
VQVRDIVQRQSKELIVTGAEYPPSPEKALLSQVLSFLSMGFILTVAVGDLVLPLIGMPIPDTLKTIQENKMMCCIGAQLIVGGFAASLTATGAFEIYVDDVLVFSKLETGQHISPIQLASIFEPYGVSFIRQ